jgi:hypothetical protein
MQRPDPPASSKRADDAVQDRLLDALRAELEHAYQVAERLDGKIQRSIGFTGAFFALVQAAAVSSLLKSLERSDQYVLLAFALAALLALGAAGLAVLQQEKLQKVAELPMADMERLVDATFGTQNDAVSGALSDVGRTLATSYGGLIDDRRDANLKRAKRYTWARLLCIISVILTSAELGFALIARLS